MKIQAISGMCGMWLLFLPHGQAQQPGSLCWSYRAQGTDPAIAADGTIYVGSGGQLHAVRPDGTNKWVFNAGNMIQGASAVSTDGTIYFGSLNGNFYALNPDGTQKWVFPVEDPVSSSPAVGNDGTIFFSARGRLFALNPDGTKKWEFIIGYVTSSSPVIGRDGTIYIGSVEIVMYAIRPDGTKKWQVAIPGAIKSSPAIGIDGTIYCAAASGFSGGALVAIDPAGTELWRNERNSVQSAPVIGKDGTIYVGSFYGELVAFTPNGELKWKTYGAGNPGRALPTAPAVAENGLIYHGGLFSMAGPGTVWFSAFNSDGTTNWQFSIGGMSGSPTVVADGTIYFCAGHLYALKGNSPSANSPWPKFRQNLRNTGRVEKPELRNPRRADAFQFDLYGQVGESYRIEGSPDLVTWTSLTSLVYNTFPFTFVDEAAEDLPARFYRAISP